MSVPLADLCDRLGERAEVAAPIFRSFGGRRAFHGAMTTVRVHEDNGLVRQALEQAGQGGVLVVDGGASLRSALLGDNLAELARQNGWAGVIVNGCIRDSEAIARIPIGVLALNTHPRRSRKLGQGERDSPVRFAGVQFRPGEYLYADADGVLICAEAAE